MLQVASLSLHLFWNCLLISILHTKLILKPIPPILTFQALHQVTQGHPSFLLKAGVGLILAMEIIYQQQSCKGLLWQDFPAGSKTTKAFPKELNSTG